MDTGKHWPKVYSSIVTVLALLFFGQAGYGQEFSFKDHRKRQTSSFQFIKNLIIVPVFINGKGPFNFVLDTGVGLVLVTEPKLIHSLDQNGVKTIKINGIGEGGEMTAFIYPSAKIELGTSITGDMPIAILKEDPFNLSSFLGIPVHGLIGYELFNSFTIAINYTSKSITYFSHETAFIPRKGSKIPISIEDRKPYVEASVEFSDSKKEKVKLIIDSGAGHPLSLETNSGVPYELPEKNIAANLGVGLSGKIEGFISRIPALAIGRFQLKKVICAFPDYSDVAAKITQISRNGNLGNAILKRFNVVFDYRRKALYLKPNYQFKEAFEHDMSGIEITSEGHGFEEIVITRIEPGSAAENVSLKEGDRIISVNFQSAKLLGIEEINNLFRSKGDRSVILEVLPEGAESVKFVVLVLKRRI